VFIPRGGKGGVKNSSQKKGGDFCGRKSKGDCMEGVSKNRRGAANEVFPGEKGYIFRGYVISRGTLFEGF